MKRYLITPILITTFALGLLIPSIPTQDVSYIPHGESQIKFTTFTPKEEIHLETKAIKPAPTPTPQAQKTETTQNTNQKNTQNTQNTQIESNSQELYYLDAPSINLHTPMKWIGRYLGQETPDNIPAVAQFQFNPDGADKLFIYGHDNTVFSRLKELPQNITLTINGKKHNYKFKISTTLTVEETRRKMSQFVNPSWVGSYHSLAIMTCAGTELPNGGMSHRLVLFYDLAN